MSEANDIDYDNIERAYQIYAANIEDVEIAEEKRHGLIGSTRDDIKAAVEKRIAELEAAEPKSAEAFRETEVDHTHETITIPNAHRAAETVNVDNVEKFAARYGVKAHHVVVAGRGIANGDGWVDVTLKICDEGETPEYVVDQFDAAGGELGKYVVLCARAFAEYADEMGGYESVETVSVDN